MTSLRQLALTLLLILPFAHAQQPTVLKLTPSRHHPAHYRRLSRPGPRRSIQRRHATNAVLVSTGHPRRPPRLHPRHGPGDRDIPPSPSSSTSPTPSGSRAGSAGFFLLESADLAAMAPGTNAGAAHPIVEGRQLDPVLKAKIENDAAAFLRSYSERRGRNVRRLPKTPSATRSPTAMPKPSSSTSSTS